MANVERHEAGSFCWIELATTDQDGAAQFYGSLLGWTAEDAPMGPADFYTTFRLEGRDTAACYTMRPEMRAQGVPPHWILYVTVVSTEETVSKADAAGGKVLAGPFDVMDFGRMAVLQDPVGAPLAIWQPTKYQGIAIEGVPGSFCWADLITPDQAGAMKFYEAVFGWGTVPGKEGSGYTIIRNGDQHIGGIPTVGDGMPPRWLVYFYVQNCEASTAKARGLGATVHAGPMNIEGVGRWSVVADPQGAVFTLFEPAMRK